MERTGLIEWLDAHFVDPRDPDLLTHPMSELLRTTLTLLAQGWTNADDADHLRHDPALRLAVSDRRLGAIWKPWSKPTYFWHAIAAAGWTTA